MTLCNLAAHSELQKHLERMKNVHMRDLFEKDPNRFKTLSVQGPEIFLDFSKNCIDAPLLDSLIDLAEEANVKAAIDAMFCGAAINNTENRAVLHTALRSQDKSTLLIDGVDIRPQITAARQAVYDFVEQIHNEQLLGFTGKPITSLVSIGIGGSYLGPLLANEALSPYKLKGFDTYFVANIDGSDLHQALSSVNPETTLFLIQSKSFGTQETLENALAAREWLLGGGATQKDVALHFAAVSSNVKAACAFGIASEKVFPMWDWVGGRYSLWSGIGLPIVFQLGAECFEALLEGAYAMDEHFRSAPFSQNVPMLMALIGIWNNNYLKSATQAVIPYSQHLSDLPAYLQQLDMESNGKRVNQSGEVLKENTGPVIWGGIGCNGQHAYHQLFHQGSRVIPVDFIVALISHHNYANHQRHLVASCLSQSQALMTGKTEAEATDELIKQGLTKDKAQTLAPHKVIPGNKPSNTLVIDKLTPQSLGALIALYEHKVFVQGVIWGINSFDQWGVELGKSLAGDIFEALSSDESTMDVPPQDSSTQGLIDRFKRNAKT